MLDYLAQPHTSIYRVGLMRELNVIKRNNISSSLKMVPRP